MLEEIENEKEKAVSVSTKGTWRDFERLTGKTFEIGKTYNINVDGVCFFAVSQEMPSVGIKTRNITYTKDEKNRLWIKTAEK